MRSSMGPVKTPCQTLAGQVCSASRLSKASDAARALVSGRVGWRSVPVLTTGLWATVRAFAAVLGLGEAYSELVMKRRAKLGS